MECVKQGNVLVFRNNLVVGGSCYPVGECEFVVDLLYVEEGIEVVELDDACKVIDEDLGVCWERNVIDVQVENGL